LLVAPRAALLRAGWAVVPVAPPYAMCGRRPRVTYVYRVTVLVRASLLLPLVAPTGASAGASPRWRPGTSRRVRAIDGT